MGSPLTTVRERERRIGVATTTGAEKGGERGWRGRTIFTGRLKNRGKN